MVSIIIEEDIKRKLAHLSLGMIYACVANSAYDSALWKEIHLVSDSIKKGFSLDNIKFQPQIHATREAYRLLGKDPNRYRPSAEALHRRIVKNSPLYQITTLVDIINLVSLKTGFSINGFDVEKIEGQVALGIGFPGEPFEAIGRGELNIENLPLFRDGKGPIGSPTSDSTRTSIDLATRQVLLVVNNYSAELEPLQKAVGELAILLQKHAQAEIFANEIIN